MSALVDRWVAAAQRHPDEVAVEWDTGRLSYAGLWRLAADVEHALVDALDGVEPHTVAVSSSRSVVTVATYVACLSRGWTYVPVPEDAPADRAAQIVSSSGAQVHVRTRTDTSTPAWDVECRPGPERPHLEQSERPACILHTSGSTGAPKGVLLTAENIDAFVRWCIQAVPLRPGDRVASLSPFHFDLCTHDIHAVLAQGAALVLPSPDVETSPQRALAFVVERGITRLYMVPTFLERLARAGAKRSVRAPDVTTVMFAGERLPAAARPALEAVFPAAELWNLYGPIETNVITALRLERGEPHDGSQVGRALPDVDLAVRSTDGEVRTHGRGELLAAGPSVTPGYLADLPDRFVRHDDRRYYATGDDVELHGDGRVVLHGRLDHMVKIRGLRIELEEVESVIGSSSSVSAVGVTPAPDGLSLVAHLQADADTDADDAVRLATQRCAEQLPPSMVPAQWRCLEVMPTTSSGKVDRQRLRASLATEEAVR